VGAQIGKTMGRTTREIIDATHLTAKEAGAFTSAFMKNFRKELKAKKKPRRR
jgi:hypothetical protein